MKPPRKKFPGYLLSAEARAQVVADYRAELTVREIADRHRTAESVVNALVRNAGLPMRRRPAFNAGIPRRP